MLILTWIRKLYKILSADSSPEAIGFAAAFGLVAGFLPLTAGMTLILLLSILLFRVQVSTAIAFWGIGSLFRLALAPLFYRIGFALLESDGARGFWTWFLNLPVIAWLDLEVYAVLGGLVAGVVAGPGVFLLMRQVVIAYRRWLHEPLAKNRFFRWLTSFWLTKALRFVFVGGRR